MYRDSEAAGAAQLIRHQLRLVGRGSGAGQYSQYLHNKVKRGTSVFWFVGFMRKQLELYNYNWIEKIINNSNLVSPLPATCPTGRDSSPI